MAALTSIAVGVGTAASVGSTISASSSSKSARKRAHYEGLLQQVKAWEASRVLAPKQNDPRIKLGAKSKEERTTTPAPAGKGESKRKTNTGVGGFTTSAAQIGGL